MTEPAHAADSDTLNAALTYAARGWPVAPAWTIRPDGSCSCGDHKCTSKGKHPLGRLVPNGLKNASTDPKTIREWWAKEPTANVLIRTGMVGDRCLVALDIDPRHNGDESLAILLSQHGDLPPTPMCCTGGGGQHIFMWAAKAIPNSAGKPGDGRFGEGVDVRGEGGYVIAAPSRHESGRSYEWDSGAHPTDLPLAEAPAWFVHLAGWSRKRREATDGADVGSSEAYIVGGRNDALMRLAGAMRRVGAGLKRITDALLDENEEKCNPPLDPAEVKKIARSAVKYPSGDPAPGGVDPFPMMSAISIITPRPPTQWLCESLKIAPGAVTIVGGAGFGGKTVSMQSLALSVATGTPIWGEFPCRQGRVIHLDYEQDVPLTLTRYERMARAMGISVEKLEATNAMGICCLPDGKLSDTEALEHLVRICTGAAVCIVDSFRRAFPTAKENDSEAAEYIDRLQRASKRTGCVMIVIMHTRKPSDGEEIKSSLRGSTALPDASQSLFMLDGAKGKPTRVHHLKERLEGETLELFGLVVEDVTGADGDRKWGMKVTYRSAADVTAAYEYASEDTVDVNANHLSLMTLVERVIAFVQGSGPHGAVASTIAFSMGRSWSNVSAALVEAVRNGGLRCEGKGQGAVYTSE